MNIGPSLYRSVRIEPVSSEAAQLDFYFCIASRDAPPFGPDYGHSSVKGK